MSGNYLDQVGYGDYETFPPDAREYIDGEERDEEETRMVGGRVIAVRDSKGFDDETN